jgi:hypothetical protein
MMKGLRNLCVIALFLLVTPFSERVEAQGMYKELRAAGRLQRDDDPFVFCTYGLRKTAPAWKPITPASLDYMPQPGFCPYPVLSPAPCCIGNVCFRAWPAEDYYAYTQLRTTVCPAGIESGSWEGEGDGTKDPTSH